MATPRMLFSAFLLMSFIHFVASKTVENYITDVTNHRNWPLVNASSCGQEELRPRILGGRNAAINEYPWIVAVYVKIEIGGSAEAMQCGGVIISESYVLTAAHCCHGDDRSANTTFLVKLDGGAKNEDLPLPVKEVKIHEEYDDKQLYNDICLVRLDTPLTFSRNVQPICLPVEQKWVTSQYDGISVTIAGWGASGGGQNKVADRLQKVDLTTTETGECVKVWAQSSPPVKVDPRLQFCGGNSVKDACMGDSGGPVMHQPPHGPHRHVLLGLVSLGQHCIANKSPEPSVFVRVSSYISWILDHMHK